MTPIPARLNVMIFISRDNFLLGCRKVKGCILVDSSTGISWTSPLVIFRSNLSLLFVF